MSTYSAKSANGITRWILSQGRLTIIKPYSPLTATDTKTLFGLLAAGSQDIINAAQMEQLGIKMQKPDDYEEDYVEGVEVE